MSAYEPEAPLHSHTQSNKAVSQSHLELLVFLHFAIALVASWSLDT